MGTLTPVSESTQGLIAQQPANATAAADSAAAAAISEANAANSATAAANSASAASTSETNAASSENTASTAATAAENAATQCSQYASFGFGGTLLDCGLVTDTTIYFPTDLGVL